MSVKSIEDAVLSFVQTVKNDPTVSDLFRDALHELEVAIDPAAAQQSQGDETAAADQGTGGEQPQGDQGTGDGTGAPPEQLPADPGPQGTPTPPEQGTQAG